MDLYFIQYWHVDLAFENTIGYSLYFFQKPVQFLIQGVVDNSTINVLKLL